jgi:RNase P subunit RPR2
MMHISIMGDTSYIPTYNWEAPHCMRSFLMKVRTSVDFTWMLMFCTSCHILYMHIPFAVKVRKKIRLFIPGWSGILCNPGFTALA